MLILFLFVKRSNIYRQYQFKNRQFIKKYYTYQKKYVKIYQ